jgi:lipase ATG15
LEKLHVRSTRQKIWRPSHPARSQVYEAARLAATARYADDDKVNALAGQLSWEEVEADVPDVGDVETLATLAKMSSNAYSTPKDEGWYDLHTNDTNRPSYNLSSSFGWAEDGIRGHVFSSGPGNESIVVALKGTSAFVGGGTGRNDKFNDNLLFSCCCARIDWTWTPVCDCYSGVGKSGDSRCNQTCLEDAMIEKSLYYPTATDLFNNITEMYPTSNIWLTGHSLGGSMAALLGATFGVPTVTFEAPGDLLAAKRLHLPLPPGSDWHDNRPDFGITHVYTNSDPIPQGVVRTSRLIVSISS